MTANELEVLNHYHRKMLKYEESPDIILKCLGKLDRVRVNIALLQNTGIGRTVSALKKKYGESDVGTLAKELVSKWKEAVAKEEEELENDESEVNENENDDHENNTPPSPPVPTPPQSSDYESYLRNNSGTPENRTQEEDSSNQDEEQSHHRKSKKKKSHRERSEERKSSRREEKEKKERHREKSHKHRNSEKEKDSKHESRGKEHRSSSHKHSSSLSTKDVKKEKCDKAHEDSKQGEKVKSKSESSSSSGRRAEERSLNGSKSDKSYKTNSQHDLSSIDMFKNIVDDCDNEPKSKKRSTNSDDREDAQSSKRSRMEQSWKSSAGLPSLGPSLIPDISPIYKPLPRVNMSAFEKQPVDDRNKDEESLSLLLSNKSKGRAAIYSGEKRRGFARGSEVPSLFSQCLQVLKENVDFIEEVGGLGFDILEPVLIMANAETLSRIEDINPHLMVDTNQLWEKFVKKKFYRKKRIEMESWREMYERCVEEEAVKLNALKGRAKQTSKAEEDSHRKTKLAYVDVAPKAPRSIRNAQVKHGTALPSGAPLVAGGPRPRNLIGDPTANSSRAGFTSKKPKTAPLMAKTFKLMRGIKGGFRR